MPLGLSPNSLCIPLQDCCGDQFLEGCTQLPTGAAWQHWAQTCGKCLSLLPGFLLFFVLFCSDFEAAAWEICKNTCIIGNCKGINVREASIGQWERRQKLKDWCLPFIIQLVNYETYTIRLLRRNHRLSTSGVANSVMHLPPPSCSIPPLLTLQYPLLLAFKLFRNELPIWKPLS